MELNGENRLSVVVDALNCAGVYVDAVDLRVAWQALGLDHIAVVLRGDVGAVLLQKLHSMVRAAVAVFHALGIAALGARHELMP